MPDTGNRGSTAARNQSFQNFHVVDGKIIFGLGAVKNVGEGAVLSILETRDEDGPFCSFQDFARRVDLRKTNKKVIESLVKCGAFDGIGPSRKAMFDALDSVLERAATHQKEKIEGQFNLFGGECSGEAILSDEPIPNGPEWEDLEKLQYEKEMMGFYVTGHPLMNYDSIIKRYTNTSSGKLAGLSPSAPVKMAGMVKRIKEINTKKGERMAFISFEDLEGVIEMTVFSDVYVQCKDLLQSGEPLIISGIREGDKEAPKVLAQEVYRVQDAAKRLSKGIQIRISTRGADPSTSRT